MIKNVFLRFLFLVPSICYDFIIILIQYEKMRRSRVMSMHWGIDTISVGNIVMGGGGKTPFTKFLFEQLNSKISKAKLIIATRGYKSKFEESGKLIKIFKKVVNYPTDSLKSKNWTASDIGDEPKLLLEHMRGFDSALLVGKRRSDLLFKLSTSKEIFSHIILDDGMQHTKIVRDFEIVLFDATMDFKNLKMFPRGYLRDRLQQLWRADLIVITKSQFTTAEDRSNWERKLFPYLRKEIPIIFCQYEMGAPLPALNLALDNTVENALNNQVKRKENFSDFMSHEWIVVSGLANNEFFLNMLQQMKIKIKKTLFYPDHFSFSQKKFIRDLGIQNFELSKILCTEKDVVKLREILDDSMLKNVFYVPLELKFLNVSEAAKCPAQLKGLFF